MDQTQTDNLPTTPSLPVPEEEARDRRYRMIDWIVFGLMVLVFLCLLFEVLNSGSNKTAVNPRPPLATKPAPSSTSSLPSAKSGIHRRSGGSSSDIVLRDGGSSASSRTNVFNSYNYYSYNSVTPVPVPTPSPEVLGASVSTNFSIIQDLLGGSGATIPGGAGSTHFTDGGSTAGDLAVGTSRSANYRTDSGYNTDGEPRLSFVIDTAYVGLGTLDITQTRTGTATFNVLAYNASGYVVRVNGTSLYNGFHYLNPLAVDTTSSAGTEQFGLNTVANSSPLLGAGPVQVPSTDFSFGTAGDGVTNAYAQANKFRFNNGEIIASSNRDSGETDYTLSFIANISAITSTTARYSTELSLVATGTF